MLPTTNFKTNFVRTEEIKLALEQNFSSFNKMNLKIDYCDIENLNLTAQFIRQFKNKGNKFNDHNKYALFHYSKHCELNERLFNMQRLIILN